MFARPSPLPALSALLCFNPVSNFFFHRPFSLWCSGWFEFDTSPLLPFCPTDPFVQFPTLRDYTRKPCKFRLCFPFKYLIRSVFCGFYSYIKRLLQQSMDSAFVLRKYIFVQSLFASDGYDNRILRFCFSSGINNPKWMCKLVQGSKPRYLCFIILVYLLCLEPTAIKFFGWG